MKRIIVQMPEKLLAELDAAAAESEMSRAAFAREAIELILAERRRDREIQQINESFRERPQESLLSSKAAIRRAWPT